MLVAKVHHSQCTVGNFSRTKELWNLSAYHNMIFTAWFQFYTSILPACPSIVIPGFFFKNVNSKCLWKCFCCVNHQVPAPLGACTQAIKILTPVAILCYERGFFKKSDLRLVRVECFHFPQKQSP